MVEALVENGVSTLMGLARASTLVEEEILVVRTLEWEGARSIHLQAC